VTRVYDFLACCTNPTTGGLLVERSEIHALFRRLSSGVYVIGVADGERRDAFTAAWVMQVSYDPLLLALSINPNHASYPILSSRPAVCSP
jgi:flavin reductase (DIM6/NTAB) family NADH-FMN oxidoreductase RutF